MLAATAVAGFLAGSVTAAAIVCSLLLGWAIGLGFRYAFGATSTRPPGTEVARALVATGIPLTRLELLDANDSGDRRYVGTTDTLPVDVHVIDRDTFGLASGRRFLRVLRLRNGFTRPPALTLRAEIEHRTLMGLVLAQARIPAPRPVSVCEVGPFAAAIAYVEPKGESLAERGDRLDDDDVTEIWRMVGALQRRRVAHRNLGPNVVMIEEDGRAGLRWVGAGDLAADDVTLRIDVAQLLTTVALSIGPERAVSSAVAELGEDAVVRAAPLLQRVAMTRATREALKQHKDLLATLRDEVVALRPSQERIEPIELRRVTLRGVVMLVGIAVAAYIVLPQFAQVDFAKVIATAEWSWALGARRVLGPHVRRRLHRPQRSGAHPPELRQDLHDPAGGRVHGPGGPGRGRQHRAQHAVPADVGPAAGRRRGRRRRRAGGPVLLLLHPAPDLGCARRHRAARVVHPAGHPVRGHPDRRDPAARAVGRAASARPPHDADPPADQGRDATGPGGVPDPGQAGPADRRRPAARRELRGRPGLRDPGVRGGDLHPGDGVVYFAGAIIGSAVPTPGGLGGIEAAMSAGLIAIGVDSGTAVSSVLLYRLATYWLPIPFGWFSLNRLQKIHAL